MSKTPPPDPVPYSVEHQLTEVYALVDELHALTDRIRIKVETVLSAVNTEGTTDEHE